MDGSSSSVGSMSSGTKSSRRPKIIGGIIGGAVGLVLVLLCIHCIVLAVRRKRRRNQAQERRAYHDTEKDTLAQHLEPNIVERAGAVNDSKPAGRAKMFARNPKNLSVVTPRLRSTGFRPGTKPLPQEPQSAPSLGLVPSEAPHSASVELDRDLPVGALRREPTSAIELAALSGSGDRNLVSPATPQTLRSPQPPQPRKSHGLHPASDDPFA